MKFHSLASEKNSQLCQYKNYDFVAILKKWLCIKIQSSFEGAVIIMIEKLCEWIIINYLIKREVIIWFQYFLWHLTEKSHSEVQGQWGATLIFTWITFKWLLKFKSVWKKKRRHNQDYLKVKLNGFQLLLKLGSESFWWTQYERKL